MLLGFHCPPLLGGCFFVVGVVESTLQLTTLPFFYNFSLHVGDEKCGVRREMLGSDYVCGVLFCLFTYQLLKFFDLEPPTKYLSSVFSGSFDSVT